MTRQQIGNITCKLSEAKITNEIITRGTKKKNGVVQVKKCFTLNPKYGYSSNNIKVLTQANESMESES